MKLSKNKLERLERFSLNYLKLNATKLSSKWECDSFDPYTRGLIDELNNEYLKKFCKTNEFDTYEYVVKLSLLVCKTYSRRLPEIARWEELTMAVIEEEAYKTVCRLKNIISDNLEGG